jgi:hypothetical protein
MLLRQITETREYQKLLAELRANAVSSPALRVRSQSLRFNAKRARRLRSYRSPLANSNRGSAICDSGIPHSLDKTQTTRFSSFPLRKQIHTPAHRRTRKHSSDEHSLSGACNNNQRNSSC